MPNTQCRVSQTGEFPNNAGLTQAWNWFSVERLPPPFGHFTNLAKFVPSPALMALFHCMVRHGTVRYGSLLGGFPLGTVPGT